MNSIGDIMLIIVGPSASGKTEIAKTLVSHFNFKKIITTTTREKRAYEINDIDYHFLSHDAFLELEKIDAFIETSIYQNNKYGLQKRDVIPFGVVILDPFGANHIKRLMKDDCFLIYIETTRSVREQRLFQRNDSMSSRLQRLESDDLIFDKKNFDHIDYVCQNDYMTIFEAAVKCNEAYQKFINASLI
jgi:guanylate kinase